MDDDALERLQWRVESKAGSELTPRRPLHEGDHANRGWPIDAPPPPRRSWLPRVFARISLLEMLFAASIIFFVGAGSIAGLLLFSGNNTISTRNVDVVVVGPTIIRAGEEVSLQVVITNRNTVPMNLTDMLIEFPPGTRTHQDVSIDLPRIRESLGTIEPGASINRTVRAVMFGTTGAPLNVTVIAEYRVPSSNAVFQSSSVYHATISQSPAAVTVKTLKEVVSGQSTDIVVTVTSNAAENLTGMLLVVTYPPGFQFLSSTPAPSSGSTVWDLGDIEPAGARTVTVRGIFTAEDGEDRVLRFTSGTKKKGDDSKIAAPLAATDATIKVARPFVSVQIALNGSVASPVAADRGKVVRGELRWTNNLPVRIQNVQIEIKINSTILDRSSVKASQAFYRSADSTLVFNKETDSKFANIEPGESAVSTFEFATLPIGRGVFQNPQIALTATVKANRSSEGGVIDVVSSSASAVVHIATDLALTSAISKVSGPLPPKVDTETVYQVTWLVTNSANAIANGVVTAVLPTYVQWHGSASSGGITYNDSMRSMTWNVGDMLAGTVKSVSYRIGVVPSITQINNPITIVSDQRLTAFDRFIRAPLERPASPITTATGISPQQGVVVP